jgi:hypothetical protein
LRNFEKKKFDKKREGGEERSTSFLSSFPLQKKVAFFFFSAHL